jgi:hypothetical protein
MQAGRRRLAAAEAALEQDADLVAAVQKIQPEREQADYDAWAAPPREARQAIELARRFLAAIEDVLD